MTPCEERGLSEGQWVWCCDGHFLLSNKWAQLRWDDGTDMPMFHSHCNGEWANGVAVSFTRIDWSQGIHNEKPNWTPREYGGEGPPDDPRDPEFWRDAPEWATHWCDYDFGKEFIAPENPCEFCVPRPATERDVTSTPHQMRHGDYILRKDIPDEETFRRVCEALERQGGPMQDYFREDAHMDILGLSPCGGASMWYNGIGSYCQTRLTLADLGIKTPDTDAIADRQVEAGAEGPMTHDIIRLCGDEEMGERHPYSELERILADAYDQSATGKGHERHSTGQRWENQPLCANARKYGVGGPFYQINKKMDESQRLSRDAAIHELRGGIVYLAAAIKVLEEQDE